MTSPASANTIEFSPYDSSPEVQAVQRLEEAAQFLDVEKWIVQRLRNCERETQLHLQMLADTGDSRIVRATRVQHTSIRGPGMGPLLFSKALPDSEIRTLAMNLSWQWALWKLPFSGSAGLIAADVDDLSEREARLLTHTYVRTSRCCIGPQLDVITPSRQTHTQLMAWALNALGETAGQSLASVMGKPLSLGGVDAGAIAARFFRLLFGCVMKQYGIAAKGATVALLGFDAWARRLALELDRAGVRVIAVADRTGGAHDPSGLNIEMLIQYAEAEHVLFDYAEAQPVSMDVLFDLGCDALILCEPEGLPRTTTARVIFEAGGEISEAEEGNSQVVPSCLADFGRNLAWLCEWRNNVAGAFAGADGLRGLPLSVSNTWREVWEYSRKTELSLKRAALTLALARVAEAMRMK